MTPPTPLPYTITPSFSILVGIPSNIVEPKSCRSVSLFVILIVVRKPKRNARCFVTNVKSLIVTSTTCSDCDSAGTLPHKQTIPPTASTMLPAQPLRHLMTSSSLFNRPTIHLISSSHQQG